MDGTSVDAGAVLAERFEEHRPHLRAVAYRMLGSLSEADDAVQEAWIRLSRAGADEVRNLGGWLTTVVGRICLDLLRARASRRETPFDVDAYGPGFHRFPPEGATGFAGTRPYVPDVVVGPLGAAADPEQQALLADSVGVALLVVLDTLAPAERLAFVLHDLFGLPFDEIAPIVDRTPAATRQLASRGRRRVRGAVPAAEPDLERQRRAVEAFLAAARDGDFDALVAVLDPDVVSRSDGGERLPSGLVRGAEAVARGAARFGKLAAASVPVLVNGAVGAVTAVRGTPRLLMAFTVAADGRITGLDVLSDPERLRRLDLSAAGVDRPAARP